MQNRYCFITAALFAAVLLCRADELLDKARLNDVQSQLQLADEYFFGRNRRQNLSTACYWFRKAALAGSPEAQYNLGMCLKNGWGCEKNPAAAFYFFNLAQQQRLKKALRAAAEMLFAGVESGEWEGLKLTEIPPDRITALNLLRQLAAGGNAEDQLLLAKYLFTDPDTHGGELRILLKKYIDNTAEPDPEALLIYAACLRSGIGGFVPDPAAGAKILQRAADMKHPEATAQLAEMTFFGYGTTPDKTRALQLYLEAVKLGSPRAMTDCAKMKLAGVFLPQDIAGAYKLLQAAAEKKYPPAICQLAECRFFGIGTAQDTAAAIELYLDAAEAGSGAAAFHLGEIFRDGTAGEKNPEKAFRFFMRSALSGHAPGMREAAKAMLSGSGTNTDYTHGERLLRRAAEMGDSEAAELLQL